MSEKTMNWDIFYTGIQEDIQNVVNQIDQNCGFPNGSTTTWAVPRQAYKQNFWFVMMPPSEGYNDGIIECTQAQMINKNQNISIQQSQQNWWPPLEDQ